MARLLATAHFLISLAVLAWDVWMAGQISRLRKAPPPFAALTALVGLLVAPALLVVLAASSILTGRTLASAVVTWLWPATLVLFAGQAIYATLRRLVTPIIGLPIAAYDAVIAAAAIVRYLITLDVPVPATLLALGATQTAVLALVGGGAALFSPLYLSVPILSPAFPARWSASVSFRLTLAALAAAWTTLFVIELPRGRRAVVSYDDPRVFPFARERLQERPGGDFALGLKLLPDLDGTPPPTALRSDLALTDTLDVDAVSVVIDPAGASAAVLDSLGRALDALRRDTTALIVALGTPAPVLPGARAPLDPARRLVPLQATPP